MQQAYNAPYVPFVSHFYKGAYKPTYSLQFTVEHGLTLQLPDSYMFVAGKAVSWRQLPEFMAP